MTTRGERISVCAHRLDRSRYLIAEIPRILDILRSIPPHEVLRLQRNLRRHHGAFLWKGRAYATVLASLERKLYNLQSEFD